MALFGQTPALEQILVETAHILRGADERGDLSTMLKLSYGLE